MHLAILPDVRARQFPDAPSVADNSLSLTNSEFLNRVRRSAGALRAQGVGPGDVVAVMLPNRVEFITTIFAAWRLGAAVTPINPGLTDAEVEYQLADSAAKVLVSERRALSVTTLDIASLERYAEHSDRTEPDLDSLALIIYTSGTTGQPKGVLLDHRNVESMCDMALNAAQLSESDHCLLILPLFHVNALVVSTFAPLLAGARTTVADTFSPDGFFETVERVRPTYFSGVPTILGMLTALPETVRPDTSSLRFVICGAAPMPAELIERFEARFGVPVVEGYGLSEGTCASTINPVDGLRKPGTVGLPMPGQQVVVVDPSGNRLPNGHPGEVVLRGPNVMRGYLNRPAETAKTIVDGWLHTGDVGRFDDDGYLVLVDRIKDMIIRGGENIYPKEIESALYRHDDVLEAAVVGKPDTRLGEVPLAFVALRDAATVDSEQLQRLCRESLAKYKQPVDIVTMRTLPKNSVGKIDKPALRAQLPSLVHG